MTFFRHRFGRRRRYRRSNSGFHGMENTLASVAPGTQARIEHFDPGLSQERRAQLQAYGLIPGRWVRVMQDWPVIVVKVEQTELALETELAGKIRVSAD